MNTEKKTTEARCPHCGDRARWYDWRKGRGGGLWLVCACGKFGKPVRTEQKAVSNG